MISSAQSKKNVIEKYGKYIVHMRQQYSYDPKRLGLVFGAGTSKGIGFPDWDELVKRISESPKMNKSVISNNGDPIKNAQKLFQYYKSNFINSCLPEDLEYNRAEMKVRGDWQKIVHEALYSGIPQEIESIVDEQHYLRSFLPIIKNIPMTINYNFDDTIQRLLAQTRTDEEKENTRGYTTVWNSNVYMYPKKCVVYHPNGFLPYNIHEHPSEQLVFLEDSFADQLIDSLNGHYHVLSNYFSQNTCLLVGLSLSDPTLKHNLRVNAMHLPGQFHYYIHYLPDGKTIDPNDELSITESNFEVYNLITLFLHEDEIRSLAELITMEDLDFKELLENEGLFTNYKYYLVGSVAVGKTTALSNFRSLATQDEWLEPMPEDMAKDPSKVDADNINLIDKWIASQVAKKNYRLLNCTSGIHMIDRAPLDAFAFTPLTKEEWMNKASLLKSEISPKKATRGLCPAHVILLTGDPPVMASRAIANQRDTDAEKLKKQQDLLLYTYTKAGCDSGTGVTVLDTKNKTKSQVAKEIARIIYLNEYIPAPLNDWLEYYASGEFGPPPV